GHRGDAHPGPRDRLMCGSALGSAAGPRPAGGRGWCAYAGSVGVQPRGRLPSARRGSQGVPADIRGCPHPAVGRRGLSSPRGSSRYALERICLGRLSHLASLSGATGLDRRPDGDLRSRALRRAPQGDRTRAWLAGRPGPAPSGRGGRSERVVVGVRLAGVGLGRALRGSGRHRAGSSGAKRMNPGRTARDGLLVATLLAVATIALSSLTVFDFWWYLASGQRILETRSVPTTDPFSYTAAGQPWINHMWATQVLFTLLWERWGRLALIGLKTATVVATFWVVLATMRARGVHPLMASAVTLLAAWTGAAFWHPRPQTFTYPLAAIFAWLLRAGWERRRLTLALVPTLVAAWVNLHAGFVMAFLMIAVAGLGTALPLLVDSDRRGAGWRVVGLTACLGFSAA